MPKFSKSTARDSSFLPLQTFVLDNGGFTTKAGFAPDWPSSDADTLRKCHVAQNSLVRTRNKRTYVAAEQETITQWSEAIFRRPVERGQLVSWEAEKEIWDHSFFDEKTAHHDVLVKEPTETTLILTEAPNTIQALQRNADEIIMEEWGFGGYARVAGPSLNAYNDVKFLFGDTDVEGPQGDAPQPHECLLIVDSGYSHTIVTPLYNGLPVHRAIRRLEIGGKQLTNYLKEVVSIRYFDLHQDTKIVNDIKEDVCFVSRGFHNDMAKTWKGNLNKKRGRRIKASLSHPEDENPDDAVDGRLSTTTSAPADDLNQSLLVDYILPDGFKIHRGFARPHQPVGRNRRNKKSKTDPSVFPTKTTTTKSNEENHVDDDDDNDDQISMTLGCERFTVPEILFHPSDIRSQQPGIPETIMQSLSVLPPALQATCLANILVVGGNARMPNFAQRLQDEVRMLAPVDYPVRVRVMGDPVTSTWLGGARMAANREVVRAIGVSREEYAEFGSTWVARRFGAAGRT